MSKMKWRSSYLTELQKSMRPGAKAELVTARKMFGGKKSIGLGTIASYRMDPKQRMQRLHYAMACAKWGTLNDAQKNAYAAWAEVNKITLFSSFLHYYLAELKEDLVLYLAMDKITGTTVKDYSKYANDGTETDCTIKKGEFIDNSLDFNGTSSNVNCGHNTSMAIDDNMTILLWAKPAALAGSTGLISKNYIGTQPWWCFYTITTSIKWMLAMGAGDEVVISPSGVLSVDVWQQIAIRLSGTNVSQYVNGKEVHNGNTTSTFASNQANDLYVGSLSASSFWFNGSIDEVRIYKKALCAEEIRSLYIQESKWHGDVA